MAERGASAIDSIIMRIYYHSTRRCAIKRLHRKRLLLEAIIASMKIDKNYQVYVDKKLFDAASKLLTINMERELLEAYK